MMVKLLPKDASGAPRASEQLGASARSGLWANWPSFIVKQKLVASAENVNEIVLTIISIIFLTSIKTNIQKCTIKLTFKGTGMLYLQKNDINRLRKCMFKIACAISFFHLYIVYTLTPFFPSVIIIKPI